MEHFLDATSPAPPPTITITKEGKEEQVFKYAWSIWYAQQQQVQGYLMGSLSREILAQVATLQTPAEVWSAIHASFAAQTQAQIVNTCIALANLHKGNMGMPEYLAKIKAFADEIACTGDPLSEGELTSYVLKGLDIEYNPVISALAARIEPVTVQELYNQLLSFEARMNLLQGNNIRQSSVNSISRGRSTGGRGRGHRGHQGRGRCNGNNSGRGRANNSGPRSSGASYSNTRPCCQLCKKSGHDVKDCWHRYDEDFVPEERHVAAAIREQEEAGDTIWYADSGATDHVTSELEKLANRERYYGNDQINTAASGGGMDICHIGQSSINFPNSKRDLLLNDVLHVPQANKNLASMSRLSADNNIFFETHPKYFFH